MPGQPFVLGGTVVPHARIPAGEKKNTAPFTRLVPGGDAPFSAARETAAFARTLVGIHEVPAGSNRGPVQTANGYGVDRIEQPCHIQGDAWCVCTIQTICLAVDGKTIADDTAGAYYLRDYAKRNKWTVRKPQVGCFVVYQVGQGHAGTVVAVYRDGTFDAVEGNYADRCELVHRRPKDVSCTFIVPPWQK